MTEKSATRRRILSPRIVGSGLLAISLVLLLTTIGLGSVLLQQTRTLESSVALTQEAVDANVRTLGQVQRELLRLRVLLASPAVDPAALTLAESFVDQRVQEGALSYQEKTLGSQVLLDRSRDLAARWATVVRPELDALVPAGPPAALARVEQLVTDLEKDYNQLVSDGEINRKVLAGQANDTTRQLLDQARTLIIGLSVTAAAFLVFMAVAGLAFRAERRQRATVAAELVALNDELRTHARVVHATDNLVVITDAEGRIDWVNDAFVRVTGYTLERARGHRPGALLQGPDTDQATVELMRAAVRAGEGFASDVLNYSADGRPYWVQMAAHPIRGADGVLSRFVAIGTDVTDRRAIEEKLRSATETALSLADEKSAFLATMSHEIRTPLNAVLGVTSLLQDTPLNPEQSEYVATAQRSGKLLLTLVNDILDFSALESGRIDIERRAFSVPELMDDVQSMFATTASGEGLSLTVQVDKDVPRVVCGDQNKVRQVITNLVANGLKFTHQGGVRVRVHVDHAFTRLDETNGTALRFTVQDTGIGIAADRQARIFQPFTQVDASTTRNYGGTGLGLSICRLIAQQLHGALEVSSLPDRGSTFSFTVPVTAAMGQDVPHAPDTDKPAARAAVSALRVLLAEDDATNRMVAVRMLGRLGVQAEVANDGEEAVRAVRDADFDLVLMDVHMPRLDGVGATAQIQRLPLGGRRRPQIVAVTANAMEGDSDRFLAAGMDGYLSKPITLGALSALLAAVVRNEQLPGDQRSAVTSDPVGSGGDENGAGPRLADLPSAGS